LHIGSVRTAFFCWLFARHFDGQFLLRIEDTDRQRSTPENVDAILDGLAWLGIDADDKPVYQTNRLARYGEVIEKWLNEGSAYYCYCSKEDLAAMRSQQMAAGQKARYDGRCRNGANVVQGVRPVVRFKNPTQGDVVVDDLVRGRVVFQNAELDDLIISRSDGSPTYNFCVVVDDFDMEITHVIRGDDHLNNTPRQLNMLNALGAEPPLYAHIPMILGPDGGKLSKRHGAVDVREYRRLGYLPEALLNYLVRLGWSHGDQEIFTQQELIRLFDIIDVNASASTFNPEKLLWVNRQYIASMPAAEMGLRLRPYMTAAGYDAGTGPDPALVADAFRERASTLLEMAESARFCYEDFECIEPDAAKNHLRPVILPALRQFRARLPDIEPWSRAAIGQALSDCAETQGLSMGKLGQPVRVAVTGKAVSPPIDVTLELVGRVRTICRLDAGIEYVTNRQVAAGS
jgi:glutamyl-tRNA synthetase